MPKKKRQSRATRAFSGRTYTVFLGLQFESKHYDKSDIVSTVERAVEMAQDDLRHLFPGVTLQVEYRLKVGETINAQIISTVKNATAAVFEVSEKNPNVYFEMGVAYSSLVTRPLLLFNKRAAKEVSVASDVRDILRLEYPNGKIHQVEGRIAEHVKKLIRKHIEKEARGDAWQDLRRIWCGKGSSSPQLTIVCPELPPSYQPKFARKGSLEFVNLAHFGDLDALVELLTLLPKLFPNTEPKYVTSAELQRRDRGGDLVVIGGPDFNQFTAELVQALPLPFTYRQRRGTTVFRDSGTDREYDLQLQRKQVCRDYGLFARFPNPLNSRNTVIMIGGLQTFGVLGAVKAFGMTAAGRKNARRRADRCPGSPLFAVLIPVVVAGGQPSISDIDLSTLRLYPW